MMRIDGTMRRWLPVALFLALAAHIGSPNVVFDGKAGPYAVRVIVRPPAVVPGRAEVVVQLPPGETATVSIRPVFWRVGTAGSPSPDDAPRVAGSANVHAGQIWLMSRGSYSVYVTVDGARGSGTAIVPVTSFATARLGLSRGLGAILITLGAVLFVGLVTIVRAATGEALLEPGEKLDGAARRRVRNATLVATPLLALLVLGGARWWGIVDGDYERTLYRPPAVDAGIDSIDGEPRLSLRVRDTSSLRAVFAPVIPDHGKMMHLFLISAGDHDRFGHYHPDEIDSLHFVTTLASFPRGRYRVFGDVLLANGLSQTVTTTVEWPGSGSVRSDEAGDDARWSLETGPVATVNERAHLGDGLTMVWTGGEEPLTAGRPVDLRFEVRDGADHVVPLAPYLEMAGHAVVLSADESVFIHLHPMGTISTTAQETFAARDRGDTTADGRAHLPAGDSSTMHMTTMPMDGRLAFPYEFPKPGRYRVWVQVRRSPASHVLTGAFDLDVR